MRHTLSNPTGSFIRLTRCHLRLTSGQIGIPSKVCVRRDKQITYPIKLFLDGLLKGLKKMINALDYLPVIQGRLTSF